MAGAGAARVPRLPCYVGGGTGQARAAGLAAPALLFPVP